MEQISINITKYKQHNDEVYQVWKDVWNEYSKEFVDATGAKFYWAYQQQDDGVYYVAINLFPSKESRDAWLKTYDVDAGNKEFEAQVEERKGISAETYDKENGKDMELAIGGMNISNTNG